MREAGLTTRPPGADPVPAAADNRPAQFVIGGGSGSECAALLPHTQRQVPIDDVGVGGDRASLPWRHSTDLRIASVGATCRARDPIAPRQSEHEK